MRRLLLWMRRRGIQEQGVRRGIFSGGRVWRAGGGVVVRWCDDRNVGLMGVAFFFFDFLWNSLVTVLGKWIGARAYMMGVR